MLSSLQVVILEPNVPNSFKEQAIVSYFIPEESGKAQMLFCGLWGRIIQTVEVQKGYGIMTVFAQNLSSGTCSCWLVTDGAVVETKRMGKTSRCRNRRVMCSNDRKEAENPG